MNAKLALSIPFANLQNIARLYTPFHDSLPRILKEEIGNRILGTMSQCMVALSRMNLNARDEYYSGLQLFDYTECIAELIKLLDADLSTLARSGSIPQSTSNECSRLIQLLECDVSACRAILNASEKVPENRAQRPRTKHIQPIGI